MLKNIKIGAKLAGGFLLVACITLIVGMRGWGSAVQLGRSTEQVADVLLPGIDSLRSMHHELECIRASQQMLLNSFLDEQEHREQFDAIAKAQKRYTVAWATYEALPKSDEEKALFQQLSNAVAAWNKENAVFIDLVQKLDATNIRNPLDMLAQVQKFRAEHYLLTNRVLNLLYKNTSFEGGDDPKSCDFTTWARLLFDANPAFESFWGAEIMGLHDIFHNSIGTIKRLMQKGDKSGAEKIYNSEMTDALAVTFEGFKKLEAQAGKAVDLYRSMNGQALAACQEKQGAVNLLIERILHVNGEAAKKISAETKQQVSSTVRTAIVWMLLGTLLAIGIGMVLTRMITVPIKKSVELANAVAQGDLLSTFSLDQKDEIGMLADAMKKMVGNLNSLVEVTRKLSIGDFTVEVQPLSGKDALGYSLQSMVATLSGTMAEINIAANSVDEGAQQLNSTSQEMSQGATEQASSLEEISSSMNQIAAQTRHNAENAGLANKLAAEARASAEKGDMQMNSMVAAMREIYDSSHSISKIIKVIDEIAFQTNLLALNAAVEAARAGKYGKGFAVVAEEVRNLAARSAGAARETAALIEGSVKKISDGAAMAEKTSISLKEIVAAAAKVTDLVAEIAAASVQQAQGVAQITQGLGQVDQVTQQNTAYAEQCAAAAQELSSQSTMLQKLMSVFTVSASGSDDASAGSHDAPAMLASGQYAVRDGG